jgi:hypothetical protein
MDLLKKISFVVKHSKNIHNALWEYCAADSLLAPQMLNPVEVGDLKQLCCSMEFLSTATKEIAKMDSILASEVLNIVSCFLGEANDLCLNSRRGSASEEFSKYMISSLEKMLPFYSRRHLALATLMDPRFRNKSGLGPNERRFAITALEAEIKKFERLQEQQTADAEQVEEPVAPTVLSPLGKNLKSVSYSMLNNNFKLNCRIDFETSNRQTSVQPNSKSSPILCI